MIKIKKDSEIKIMKEAGEIAALVRDELVEKAVPGIRTKELDKRAEELIQEKGAIPNFKGYRNYPCSIVTCVNQEVIHGVPGVEKLKEGDLLTIDLGVFYNGFHTDTAVTVEVGNKDTQKRDTFLAVGREALNQAIKEVRPQSRVGDISHAIQATVEAAGYNVVREFVGHGIGWELHEAPQIPCFGEAETGEELEKGMTLAVEVMYCKGDSKLKILKDGWTAVTADGSLSAMFEHTVAVTKDEPLILTSSK